MQISKNDLILLNTNRIGCALPKYRAALVSIWEKPADISAQWRETWTLPKLTREALSAGKQRGKQKQDDQQKSGTGWVKHGIPD